MSKKTVPISAFTPDADATPYSLGLLLFAPDKRNIIHVFMVTARVFDEPQTPWKFPNSPFRKFNEPLMEASHEAAHRIYGLTPQQAVFYNALPQPFHRNMPEEVSAEKKRKHTITSWAALRCESPFPFLVRKGLREWFPADAAPNCWQKHRVDDNYAIMGMLKSLNITFPDRTDH